MISPFRLRGFVAAAHTPFHDDGSLAPEVVPRQAAHLAAHGIRTVFITGTTGESHSLSVEERIRIYQAWAEAAPAHGLRVVAHVGDNCLGNAAALASAAAGLGFAATAAQAPCYFKPATVEALVECCAVIASAAPALPFYYYDIPALTGVKFDMVRFLALASKRLPNLGGIKFTHDDPAMYEACLAFEDGRFDLPWGIDEKLLLALPLGAEGAVGSTYNFAAPLYHRLMEAYAAGDHETARELQRESQWLVDQLASIGYFGAAKALMGWLGVPVGPPRLPLGNPSPAQLAELREKLRDFRWLGPAWDGQAAVAATP